MPLSPTRRQDSQCLPSEIIGVTTEGSLMFNSDAILYHTRNQDELLGYARDGFPIYGNYKGETDECGGYNHAIGYRYTISDNRNYTIGCFGAQPMPFLK